MKMLPTLLAVSALTGFAYSKEAKQAPAKPNFSAAAQQIDTLLAADWKKNKLAPNAPSTDEVFVRRVYLDVVGRIPTYRESDEFIASKNKNKRAELIDQLLASEGYVQHFFNFWADILRAQSAGAQTGAITGTAYTSFIKESLRQNKPYDQFVRDLVAAQGQAWENGAIGYYMRDRGMPLDNMANTVRIFLGTRIECAQCHNHPFDKWTQKQFYEMAAFTYGVETNDYYGGPMSGVRGLMRDKEVALRDKMKAAKDKPEEMAAVKSEDAAYRAQNRFMNEALTRVRDPLRYTSASYKDKKLVLPHDYKYPDAAPKSVVAPQAMMGNSVDCPQGSNSLVAYAAWMTSKENPRFTNLIANRLWKKVFGLGLIEPVDELMDSTVAMNPELMTYLEGYMKSVNYDVKTYLRTLLNTKTYQNSVTKEEVPAGVVYHFTGPVLRRMSAEQMWDSFVALINPTPDMPNITAREASEKRVLGAKKMSDALDTLTPEEMLKGAEIASGKYSEQSTKVQELQKQIAEARASDDKDRVKELGKEVNELQRNALKSVNDNIFVPGMKKLLANVSGKKAPELKGGDEKDEAPGGGAMAMGMGMGTTEAMMQKITVPGYDQPKKTEEQIKAEREERTKVIMGEADYFGLAEKEKKQYVNYRNQQTQKWLRSAEIESPAPRGHYLREFGQSDREFIENANSDASVPQALAMMNSTLLPEILSHYSQLMLTINKAPYPDEKLEAAYMTLLSRKPTAKEKELWAKASENGLTTMEDLIYSLINTQQFIFIQ
jgi:hypothetical protein